MDPDLDYTSRSVNYPVERCKINYSNSLWLHVAKSMGSLKRLK